LADATHEEYREDDPTNDGDKMMGDKMMTIRFDELVRVVGVSDGIHFSFIILSFCPRHQGTKFRQLLELAVNR
jgi:hypothetical protein